MNDDKSQKELRNIPIIDMVIFIAFLGIGITMFNQHVENEVKGFFQVPGISLMLPFSQTR